MIVGKSEALICNINQHSQGSFFPLSSSTVFFFNSILPGCTFFVFCSYFELILVSGTSLFTPFLLSISFSEILRNKMAILLPLLAETYIYGYRFFSAYSSSYFLDTSLSAISDLFPTRKIIAYCPRDYLTKSSHLSTPSNDVFMLTSITMRQASASRT